MNDRYLFKAKRIDNGEWTKGYYSQNHIGKHFIDCFEVDPTTICQCTGLKDKNGTLIWENDVVRWQGKLYVVKWFDSICSFVLYRVCGHWNHMEMNYGQRLECFDYEVIGSIFDNPELLEVEHEAFDMDFD